MSASCRLRVQGLADSSALTAVIQRSGKRDVARAVFDRLSRFQGTPVQGEAKADLETAEQELREGTARLQDAFVTLMRSALSHYGQNGREGESALDLDAIKERIERLERRQRSPSPVDKGKGKERVSERPPTPPRPASPTPTQGDATVAPKVAPEAAKAAEGSHPPEEGKKGRARAILNEILRRLEEIEGKVDGIEQTYEEVTNDVAVLDTDLHLQTERIDRMLGRRRQRLSRIQTADVTGNSTEATSRKQTEEASAPPDGGVEAGEGVAAKEAREAPATQDRDGEQDMDIDDESEAGAAAPQTVSSPKPDLAVALKASSPKPDSNIADEMAKLREQMANMEERLTALQSTAKAEAEAPAAKSGAIGTPASPAADTSPKAPSTLPLPPIPQAKEGSPAGGPSPATIEALDNMRASLAHMSTQLAQLQERADSALTTSQVEAILEKERAEMEKRVQGAVQALLDRERASIVKETLEATHGPVLEHITKALPKLVQNEVKELAHKANQRREEHSTSMSKTTSNHSTQSVPVGVGAGGAGAVRSPVSATAQIPRASPPVPLQHRLSLPQAAPASSQAQARSNSHPTLTTFVSDRVPSPTDAYSAPFHFAAPTDDKSAAGTDGEGVRRLGRSYFGQSGAAERERPAETTSCRAACRAAGSAPTVTSKGQQCHPPAQLEPQQQPLHPRVHGHDPPNGRTSIPSPSPAPAEEQHKPRDIHPGATPQCHRECQRESDQCEPKPGHD